LAWRNETITINYRNSRTVASRPPAAQPVSHGRLQHTATLTPPHLRTPARTGTTAIVIPCHGQAHYLAEAIESVVGQTCSPAQVIVVDDGSPDATFELASAYAAAHANVECIQQTRAGLCAARNAGLAAARTDYVGFLDADDRLVPNALCAHLRALNKHPDWVFVFGEHRRITAEGERMDGGGGSCREGDLYEELLRNNVIGMGGAVLYRRSVLTALGGFDERFGAAEDYELCLRILQSYRAGCHGEIVAEYRRYPGSMSSDPELMLTYHLMALEVQDAHVRGKPQYLHARRAGMREWTRRYRTGQARGILRDALGGQLRPVMKHPRVVLRYGLQALASGIAQRLRAGRT
jgi:glycosyltransferase involved in cell wall biosynthesis